MRTCIFKKFTKDVDSLNFSRCYFSSIAISLRSNIIKFLLMAYSDYSSSKWAPNSIFFLSSYSSSLYEPSSWVSWLRVLAFLISLEWNSSNPNSEINFLMLPVHFSRVSIPSMILLMILMTKMFNLRLSALDFCWSLNFIFVDNRFSYFLIKDYRANFMIDS